MDDFQLAREILAKCSPLRESDNSSEEDYWISGASPAQAFAYSAIKSWYSHFVVNQNGDLISHPTVRNRTGFWVDKMCHISSMKVISGNTGADGNFLGHVRSFGYVYRKFRDYDRVDYIPEDKGGVSMVFLPHEGSSLEVEFTVTHMEAWPSVSQGTSYVYSESGNSFSVKSDLGETRFQVFGDSEVKGSALNVGFSIKMKFKGECKIYVSGDGSPAGPNDLERAVKFHSSVKENTVLKTPDMKLNKLFLWAKHDLLELFSRSSIGSGFYAGLPGFSWFFGRDGEWMSLAATEAGLGELSREHQDLLWKYSKNGRIPHELPLSSLGKEYGFDINGSRVNTRFLSIDSSPLWVINEIHLSNWSGAKPDLEKINEVMAFVRTCDKDGDGLIENNFNEGLIGWVEEWAKERDGACVDVNALYIQAEKMLHLFSGSNAINWKEAISNYSGRFIKEVNGKPSILDSINRGREKNVKTPMELIPFIFFSSELGSISHEILDGFSGEDMLVPWGMRSLSSKDRMYDDGYHTGMVWPLMTGWATISCFASGRPDLGMKLLNTFVTLAFSSNSIGRLGEVYSSSDMRETGQFFQGWSSSMFVSSVIEGLLGMTIGAIGQENWESKIHPYLPDNWERIELLNVKKGKDICNIIVDSSGVSVKEADSVIYYGEQGRK